MAKGLHVNREDEGVVILKIDNPPMNAMDPAMLQTFMETLDSVEADLSIRCMVLIGEGRAFSVGEDLKELSSTGEELKFFMRLVERLEASRVPIIAAINGFCAGGGFEIALSADICLASEKAVFICAGANMGGLSEPLRLIRRIGMGYAKEMLYTGDQYDAATALRYGVVTRVFPPGELEPAAIRMAKRIATRAPLSIEATKRVTAKAHLSPEEFDPIYWEELLGAIRSDDLQEGIAAFKERRQPAFERR